MASGVNVLMQMMAAILIVVVLFVVGFSIYNMEILRSYAEMGKLKQVVPIFYGMADITGGNSGNFNTLNPNDESFRNIAPSVNQPSGAEFTYNFWLYKNSTLFTPIDQSGAAVATDSGLSADQYILFVHGDGHSTEYKNLCNVNKTDVMVKCPLVKLERGGTMLTVEFNTLTSKDAVRERARDTCNEDSRDWNYMNSHKLAIYTEDTSTKFDQKWFMVTIVMNDTTPTDPLPLRNKVRCRIYVNGVLELDRYVDDAIGVNPSASGAQSAIRRNSGNLWIAPKVKVSSTGAVTTNTAASGSTNNANKLMMADLTYFNYAITDAEIKSLFDQKFTKKFVNLTQPGVPPQTLTNTDSMSLPETSRSFNAL